MGGCGLHGGSRVRGLALGPASQKCSPFGVGMVLGQGRPDPGANVSDGGGRPGTWEMSPLRYLTSFTWLSPFVLQPLCFLWGAFLDFLVARLLPYTQAGSLHDDVPCSCRLSLFVIGLSVPSTRVVLFSLPLCSQRQLSAWHRTGAQEYMSDPPSPLQRESTTSPTS